MNKKYYYGCNKDRASFAYYIRIEPQTKDEKEYAEEEGFQWMVRHPRTKEERKEAIWMYSFDAERWDPMEGYWDTCPDTTQICEDCKEFLKRKFPKDYNEAIEFWKKEGKKDD